MHDDGFDQELPEELRRIEERLHRERSAADGHMLERVFRRVTASEPRGKSFGARVWPRIAVAVAVTAAAAVFVTGHAPGISGSLGGFSLANVTVSSSSSGATSAADDTYCDDNTKNDCTCPNPPQGWPDLSPFWAKYAVFGLNYSGSQTLNFDSGTWYGNIGVPSGAKLIVQRADKFYNSSGGTPDYVDLAHGATYSPSGTPSPAPTILQSTSLDSQLANDRTALISESAKFASLTPTVTYTNGITNANSQPIVITGGPGINVINVNGNVTLTSPLVLSGTQNSFFVLNINGNINLQGSSNGSSSVGQIVVGGTTPTSNLVVNIIGAHSIYSDRNGEQIQGTLLGPQASGASEFAGSYDAVYIGGNFEFQSYPTIHGEGCGNQS